MPGTDGCAEPFFCWSRLPSFAVAWDRLQLPGCPCEPCSHLVAPAWSRHICRSLLPQQCPKPALAVAPLLRNCADPSPVRPTAFSPRNGYGRQRGTIYELANPPCLDLRMYLVISFAFSRGKEVNFEFQICYSLFFLGDGRFEGVYLLFQLC